jgi:hypothetical protein
MLEKIQKQVQAKADQHHSDIVLKVFQGLLLKHNPSRCNCNYCLIKYKYVAAKIQLQHLKNRRDMPDFMEPGLEQRISTLSIQVKLLKQQKDSLKKIACF